MLKDLRRDWDYWSKQANKLTNGFVDFFLPPVCASCGSVGQLICVDCHARVTWLEEPVCPQCGRPQLKSVERCSSCNLERAHPVRTRAATVYDEPVRTLIHRMKFEGLFGLAAPLGDMMVNGWEKWHSPVDLVLPIPLHPDRRRDRGYNQSALLVDAVKQHIDWPTDATALQRKLNTRPQIGLSAAERRDNVSGAFWADPSKVNGSRVLLVDDVCTTGSTLRAAADSLLEAGATSVDAFCLALAVTPHYSTLQ